MAYTLESVFAKLDLRKHEFSTSDYSHATHLGCTRLWEYWRLLCPTCTLESNVGQCWLAIVARLMEENPALIGEVRMDISPPTYVYYIYTLGHGVLGRYNGL